MDTKNLDAIKDQLQEQQAKLTAKAAKLRAELSVVDEDLGRIEAALAILSGAPLPSADAKLTKKERKKASAPSASKADVIRFMQSILLERGAVAEGALKALVEAKAAEAGFTRMGLALRFKEALAEPQLVQTPAGVRLKEDQSVSPNHSVITKGNNKGTNTSNGTTKGTSYSHTNSTTESTIVSP